MRDEDSLEAEINAKGLNAPRLSPDLIDSKIKDAVYFRVEGTTTTICALTLENGFTVQGHSGAVSLQNFDEDLGRRVAYEKAREKIWELEGYLLRQKLFEAGIS